jgi:hypothetical protein
MFHMRKVNMVRVSMNSIVIEDDEQRELCVMSGPLAALAAMVFIDALEKDSIERREIDERERGE